jgi:hypothetical protein
MALFGEEGVIRTCLRLFCGSKKDREYEKPGKEAKAGGIGETLAMIQKRVSLLNLNSSARERNVELVNVSWRGWC